jgi:hypothetical protein
MGDRLKAKQAEKFKHAQDAAYDAFSVPDLIRSSRPELLFEELGCRLGDQVVGLDRNAALMLQGTGPDGDVMVVHGNRVIGALDETSARRVREVISKAGGILPCKVSRSPSVTRFFTVKVAVDEGDGRRRK